MLLKVCTCGEFVEQTPCPRCRKEQAARKPPRSWRERQRRKRAVDAWVRLHGHVCPGWRRPEHTVEPGTLTADHVTPRAHGGGRGPLRVLCRSCNSARGARQP